MPVNFGLVGAGGAKGASDALQEILKRRFLEQQEADQVANEQRQRATAQQLADQQGTYQSGILGNEQARDELTRVKFRTEQDSKEMRRERLRAFATAHPNTRLGALAEAQLAEIEGLRLDLDATGPQMSDREQSLLRFTGKTSLDQVTPAEEAAFDNWKTDNTTRQQFLPTTGGFMAGSPGRQQPGQAQGVTPVTPAPVPPRAPGTPAPRAPVQPIVPGNFFQGGSGIVFGDRRGGAVTPAINTATGQQEGLPPALYIGPEGGVTANKVSGVTKPLTTQTGEPLGKAASPGTAARIAVYDNAIDTLRDLIAMKDDSWIGPVDYLETQARLTTGAGLNDARAAFAAKNAELKNTIVQAVTGKQLSEAEGARIMAAVPDLPNPSVTWNQRAAAALEQITRTRNDELKLAGVSTGSNLEKTITRAELQAIANDTGTTLEYQIERFRALKYTIR